MSKRIRPLSRFRWRQDLYGKDRFPGESSFSKFLLYFDGGKIGSEGIQ